MSVGTPGTGKSTVAEQLAESLGFKYYNVTEIAQKKEFTEGYDEERKCHILDEDKVSG